MSSPDDVKVKTGARKLGHQYKLLMWKNLLLLRRSPFRIAVEIFWPLSLFLILTAVRSRQSLVLRKSECHFHNKPMPSAGMLPFFQGVVCLSNNTCSEREVTDELSGRLTSFETTPVEQLMNDTANFLANDTQRDVLREVVEEVQKISSAYSTAASKRESLGQLLDIDEPSFYADLEAKNVPLTNRTVDLLLTRVTINSTALEDELMRIQERNPDFVPLLETLLADIVELPELLNNDSSLWGRIMAEDFLESITSIPNVTLPTQPGDLRDRLAELDFSGVDRDNLPSQMLGIQSPEEIAGLVAGAVSQAGLDEQVIRNVLELSNGQQEIVTQYCEQAENANTSACLLLDLLSNNNATDRAELLRELCSQPRYTNLTTCLLWDLANVRDIGEIIQVTSELCERPMASNSSLCAMVDVADRLRNITDSVDPREVLCWGNTTILVYDSEEVRSEVEPQMCNLTIDQLRALQDTLADHVNLTAVWELYFPDGLDPEVIFRLVNQLQELSNMPSVQEIMAEMQEIADEGFGLSFCGSASDVPLMAPFAVLRGFGMDNQSAIDSNGTTVTAPWTTSEATTAASVDKSEEDIEKGQISQSEYLNHNSSEWRHYQKCRNLFRSVTDAQGELGDFVYRQLEPILFGKIPYSPATDAVKETIKQANKTFQALASIQETANEIRNNYKDWENTMNNIGKRLGNLDRFLNLTAQGPGDRSDGLISPQQFLEVMMRFAGQRSNLPFSQSEIPTNLTATVERLANLSRSLEEGGQMWNAVDQLGRVSEMIYEYMDCVELDKFEPYMSELSLESRSVQLIKDGQYWAAIVFNDSLAQQKNLPSHVSYKIRMNTDKVDGTEKIEDKYWNARPRARPPFDTKYISFGFAYLQDMIEHSLIGLMSNNTEQVGIYLQQFPYPCYNKDYFVSGISRMMPLFMVLSWIFSVALLVKSIVYEKQERLKEQMKIMGLTNGIHWFAWYTISVMLITPSIFFLCIIFKHGRVLEAADASVMALMLFAFSFATTGQAFLFSVFFTKANLAACCGAIFYFVLYLPYTVVYQYEETMTDWMKGISCLLSPVAFGLGTTYVARYEEQGIGIQWNNITESPLPGDTYNLAKCIGMMFLDGILYWFLAWYKEHVFPGSYGMPKPFYFLFTKSFWCGPSSSAPSPDLQMSGRSGRYNVNQSSAGSEETGQSANCEVEPTHLPLGVQLRNLTKVYSTGKKLAVDKLSLNLYQDQITSFLGHNGAGKTTTMSILCGLFPPTDGTAVVYDKDIRHDLDAVRQSMGFCPQFNVLYSMLTVAEHILFYGQLKGLTYEQAEEEMNSMLQATGMMEKADAKTKDLSGGMKRKLSVMCAFVGGSKCVVLDEPTAGVDPYSRRQIWELLLKFKHGRTILLSTHHMDEADFLGDRIAIISHGKLCCVGSSLYLKALHGNGYYLTLVRADSDEASSSLEQDIEKFVLSRVPGSVLMEAIGQEMVFQLPSSEVKTGAFVTLFNDLDSNLEKLDLTSYGICDTTLEEVFLKIADETGVDTEALLTDGGNLAMPASRGSLRWKKGARRVIGKVKERFSKLKLKKPGSKYERQMDDLDNVSVGPRSLAAISEVDPESENAVNSERGRETTATEPLLLGGDTTDDEVLSDEEETTTVGNGGHLSIRFSSTNGQVSSTLPNQSQDGENKANKLSGWRLVVHQMKALLVKRFRHVWRDKVAFLCEIVLPSLFILIAMAFALAVPPVHPQPPLELQPWMYEPDRADNHLNFFYRNEYADSNFTRHLEQLLKEAQYGTRCMNPDVYQIAGKPCLEPLATHWTPQSSQISPVCDCQKTGYQQCEATPGMPANATLSTNDHVLNLTGHNVSEWLVKTMQPYIKRRYGGFSFDVGGSSAYVNESNILTLLRAVFPNASDINETRNMADTVEDLLDTVNIHENIKVWFNNKGWTSSVSYMNAANNLLLRSKLKQAGRKDYRNFGITAINHPMNRTDYQFQQKVMERGYVTLLISLCVIFAMSLIPATFVLYLIMDRVSTSKSLQYVSGMNRMVYWITNFMWDMFNYSICASLCFFIFLAFNEKAYVSEINGPCLAVLMLLYGWAMIPLMYPFSYLFKESSMAYVVLGCLNIFLGIVSTVSTFILENFPDDDELVLITTQLKKAFLILPHYCLGRGLIDMSIEHLKKEVADILGQEIEYNPFDMDIAGKNMVAMFVQGCVFFFIVIMVEYKFFYHRKATAKPKRDAGYTEEDDVLAEEAAIYDGSRPNDVLKTKNLTKLFKKHRAVNGLSFGVPSGQCFGLLGVNGAGKTTTFRMLTGISGVSGGDALMLGHSITQDPTKVQQLIGYCPQFDAIDPLLTVTEHLEYYAKIRGVASPFVKSVAMKKLKKMGLIKYRDKRAGDLSGGNKRKLQAAIALIGNPAVIFMDEPTTGMDPKARRFLWDSILKITKEGHAVVLTSHSMEECEVLCNRLAIMVNGTFRCLGTPQHLKNKYGEGYHVTIRITRDTNPDISALINAMDSEFSSSTTLLESSLLMAQYHISSNIAVAEIFSRLENIRERCAIEDYSVTQTSLDHVFIRFAKQQTDGLGAVDSPPSDSPINEAGSMPSRANSQLNLIV